jgi:hypothetical protein
MSFVAITAVSQDKLEKFRMASANPGMIYLNGIDQKVLKGEIFSFTLNPNKTYMLEIADTANFQTIKGFENARKDGKSYWFKTGNKAVTISFTFKEKKKIVVNLYYIQ